MKFTVKTIVAIGIGAALFFVLARFVSVPVFANTYLSLQYAVLGFFAAVFGPIAGLLIGFIGHTLVDLTWGSPWWSWIIASAIVGFLSGFLLKGIDINAGELGKKGVLRFIIGSIIIHMIAWVGIAPALDILIYAEPTDKIFAQGLIAGTGNAVLTCIVGTILLVAYAKTRTGKGSLDKE